MTRYARSVTISRVALASAVALAFLVTDGLVAQGGRQGAPPPDPTRPHRLEITDGSRARYRVQEQFVGIDFPSDAVGTTEAITGAIIVNPDGSIDPQSKLTVDLRTLTSDQSMRDGYVQRNTLETEEFPMLELVPTRTEGLAVPLPASSHAGFRLVSDMTLHGVTQEVVWTVVAVFGNDTVNGTARTTVNFDMFEMETPSVGRLMGVEDEINLEVEFRFRRSVV